MQVVSFQEEIVSMRYLYLILLTSLFSLFFTTVSLADDTDESNANKPTPAVELNQKSHAALTLELINAISKGDMKKITELVESGADVNGIDRYGISVLIHAILASRPSNLVVSEPIKYLVENGANVNLGIRVLKEKPLHFAVRVNNLELVKYFLEGLMKFNKADVNVQNVDGESPIYLAVKNQNQEMVQYFLKKKASVNTITKINQLSLIHIAAKISCDSSKTEFKCANLEIIKLLSKKAIGLDFLSLLDVNQDTPLHTSVRFENLEISKHLINYTNINIDAQNKSGWTALHFASFYDDLDSVKLLIESGAKLGLVNKSGLTAYGEARERGHIRILDYLKKARKQRASKNTIKKAV